MVEVQNGVIEKFAYFSIAIAVIPLCVLYAALYGYCDRECSSPLTPLHLCTSALSNAPCLISQTLFTMCIDL